MNFLVSHVTRKPPLKVCMDSVHSSSQNLILKCPDLGAHYYIAVYLWNSELNFYPAAPHAHSGVEQSVPSICLSVCLSVCLPVSVCLSVCLSICVSVCLSVCLTVCLPVSVCLSV